MGVGNTPFGTKLISYLNQSWGDKDISVFGERTRGINGSETLHWRIERVHSRHSNNINQFIRQMQIVEHKCSLSIKQFHNCIQSKKQQMIEKMHADIENIFNLELSTQPEESAITNFFSKTVHFTKIVHNHFIKMAANNNSHDTGHSLFIADKYVEAAMAEIKRNKRFPVVNMYLLPNENRHKRRMLTLRVGEETNVQKQRNKTLPAKNNIVINDAAIAVKHATLKVTTKLVIEIKDNASRI